MVFRTLGVAISRMRPRRDDRLHDRDGRVTTSASRRLVVVKKTDTNFVRRRVRSSTGAGNSTPRAAATTRREDRRRGRRPRRRSITFADRDRDAAFAARSRVAHRFRNAPRGVHRDDLARQSPVRDARPRSRDCGAPGPATPPATVAASRGIPHRPHIGAVAPLQPRRRTVALRTCSASRRDGPLRLLRLPVDDEPSSIQPLTSPASPSPDGSTRPQRRGRRRRREPGLGRPGTPRTKQKRRDRLRRSGLSATLEGAASYGSRTRPNSARTTPRLKRLQRLRGWQPTARAEPFGTTAQRRDAQRRGLDARVRSYARGRRDARVSASMTVRSALVSRLRRRRTCPPPRPNKQIAFRVPRRGRSHGSARARVRG